MRISQYLRAKVNPLGLSLSIPFTLVSCLEMLPSGKFKKWGKKSQECFFSLIQTHEKYQEENIGKSLECLL